VRFALWDYQNGQALTAVCDTDVDTFCPKVRSSRAERDVLEAYVGLRKLCRWNGRAVGAEGLLCHVRWWLCVYFGVLGSAPSHVSE